MAGDGGRPLMMVLSPSPAVNGRPAVIYLLGRDGLIQCRPVRPGDISDSITVPGSRTGRLRTLITASKCISKFSKLASPGAPPIGLKYY